MPRFPNDVADVPIFFEGVEKLFISFEVPDSLQSKLLLPYLSDKAKSLLLRLEQSKQDKYSDVKEFLINELKLTPVQFKERFDRAVRNKDETYTMFCSRLKNLLTYYTATADKSKRISKLYFHCWSQIKSSQHCLRHVSIMC